MTAPPTSAPTTPQWIIDATDVWAWSRRRLGRGDSWWLIHGADTMFRFPHPLRRLLYGKLVARFEAHHQHEHIVEEIRRNRAGKFVCGACGRGFPQSGSLHCLALDLFFDYASHVNARIEFFDDQSAQEIRAMWAAQMLGGEL